MKVLWFNGNFGNQIFYCAFKDYLLERFPGEKVYAFIDPRCPPVKVEERTNLSMPKQNCWISILSFVLFKLLGVLFRRIPDKYIPNFLCVKGDLNENASFIGHSMQNKSFYERKRSDWLIIKEPPILNQAYFEWKQLISNTSSVCVHLRRGDYVRTGSSYVDLSSTDYYKRAIEYSKAILPDAKFFFFSDDLDYVRELFKGDNVYYVDCNRAANGFLDMKLMSLAKVNIMANSTFSYWASYMGHEHKTVIYPRRWFCDWTGRKAPDIMLDKNNWIGL